MSEQTVLVEVYLPAAGRSFDVRLPLGINVHQASMLTAEALAPLAEGMFKPGKYKNCFLAWRHTGQRLPSGQTVFAAGVKAGHQLMLI